MSIAIVPAYNEEGAIGDVVDEIRAFDPSFDVVVIDDGSHGRHGVAIAAAHGAAVVTFRSTSGSAAPCRRGSSTRSSTATSWRCGSTATASTIPAS